MCPDTLYLSPSKIPGAGDGVWTRVAVPVGTLLRHSFGEQNQLVRLSHCLFSVSVNAPLFSSDLNLLSFTCLIIVLHLDRAASQTKKVKGAPKSAVHG